MRIAFFVACITASACKNDCPQVSVVDCPDIDECEPGDTDVGCGASLVTFPGMDPDAIQCWALACISRPGEVDTCDQTLLHLQGDLWTASCADPRVDHIIASCISDKCLR